MKSGVNPWRVLVKGLLLFVVLEYALVWAVPGLAPLNVYAALNMKRERFPLSTISPADDAQDVGNLDAMFASHTVSNPKAPNEYRVFVFGDSAVWGLQLKPGETLPGQLDALNLTCGNKHVRVYNLSFPRSSATKDLMILDTAMQYQPDMILWMITWYALMPKTRIDHWLVTQNPAEFYKLGHRFDFLPKGATAPTWMDTLTSRSRELSRETRFQLYSLVQLATGLDQIPGPPEVLPTTLSSDTTFEGLKPPTLHKSQVSLDQIQDFYTLAGNTPVVLINQPILPSPVEVAKTMAQPRELGELVKNFGASLWRVLGSMFLSVLLAVPAGLVLGQSPRWNRISRCMASSLGNRTKRSTRSARWPTATART